MDKNQINKSALFFGIGVGGLAAIFVFISFFAIALPMFIVSLILSLIAAIIVGVKTSSLKSQLNGYIDETGGRLTGAGGYIGLACFLISSILLLIGIFVAGFPMAIISIILLIIGVISVSLFSSFNVEKFELAYTDNPVEQNNSGWSDSVGEYNERSKRRSNTKAKYCESCGAKLSPTSKFCPECGKKVK